MNPVDKFFDAFVAWCARDTPGARFERSILQGIIGVIVTGITTGEWGAAALTGVIMAVLAPVQKAIGDTEGKE